MAKGDRRKKGARRACILTGGGDAPGLNAVIRAFVKTSVDFGIDVLGSEDGFEGLIQPGRLVQLGKDDVRGILPRGGSILGCSNVSNPFAYPRPRKGGKVSYEDASGKVLRTLDDHGIEALVLVGGDGTMTHAKRLMDLGVAVVGVPKTIDNDLTATDLTFGFDTAVSTATWAIDALHTTAESHDRVMIVELMGRYAGWISLCAGIAGGADVVLIPEIPYRLERVVAKIMDRQRRGARFSIVVVGEGAHPRGAKHAEVAKGRRGHLPRLGGAGQRLADALHGKVPHDVRVTVLGHLQRGGSPVAFDRLLGTRFGVKAAHLVRQGRTGRMVALRGQNIVSVPLAEVTAQPKLVPADGELAEVARSIGIELGG
jgi:6-phosphofructokinase 1